MLHAVRAISPVLHIYLQVGMFGFAGVELQATYTSGDERMGKANSSENVQNGKIGLTCAVTLEKINWSKVCRHV